MKLFKMFRRCLTAPIEDKYPVNTGRSLEEQDAEAKAYWIAEQEEDDHCRRYADRITQNWGAAGYTAKELWARRNFASGCVVGRGEALEQAARAAGQAVIPRDCSPAEAHGRLMQAAASRDAVLALIKEPKA